MKSCLSMNGYYRDIVAFVFIIKSLQKKGGCFNKKRAPEAKSPSKCPGRKKGTE